MTTEFKPPLRKVIHIDCDCFFASVEMRENPALRDVPMAVGGSSCRGVLTTCNYSARAFGARSAMSTHKAKQLCPQLIVLPVRMDLYREVSRQLMQILAEYAVVFEQVSVDEAYLEIAPEHNATAIAAEIRQRVEQELGITVSAGVATNKFLAKVASDWNKPNGQFVVKPHHVTDFVRTLPLSKIPGIGPAAQKRLAAHGLHTCEDVWAWSITDLAQQFGRTGVMLHERSRGIDNRPVSSERVRKSISVERTFSQDMSSMEECLAQVPMLWQQWLKRVERQQLQVEELAPFVKVKFADFSQTTLADCHEQATSESFRRLLEQAILRSDKAVRLLGIGGKLPEVNEQQLELGF